VDNDAILKRADAFMQTSNKSNQFRAYDDYKSIYLRSIMNNDDELKIKALNGIVNSGNKLHIDISAYSEELLQYQTKKKPLPAPPQEKKHKESPVASPVEETHTMRQAEVLYTSSKKSDDIKITSSHKLKSIRWQDGRMILNFDNSLEQNQINYFTLYDSKQNKYRYIFDIHASMLTESQNLRKDGVGKIRLAQFNQNTLRLVIENDVKLNIRYKVENEQIVINVLDKPSSPAEPSYVPSEVTPKRLDRNKTIVIDAGHGGKDPGAIGRYKDKEKVIVMDIASQLKEILKSRGYKVHMTRDRDIFVKLSHRTQFANKRNADIFVSIHANAVAKENADNAHGIECYFLSNSRSSRAKKVAAKENSADLSDMNFYGKESFLNTLNKHNIVASNKLAIDLQRGMLGALSGYSNVHDGGVREGPFWVLVGAQMPSVLVEVGFISHSVEAKRLVDRKYQKSLATGMANGVERYFLNN
jgi:N-acetylmuramoyl-L-alanine amidase